MSEPTRVPTAETAEIHDLGYKRYAGPRRPASARWRVIMRHQIAQIWKTRRYKLALGLTIIATVISAAVMYVRQNEAVAIFGDASPRLADAVVPLATLIFCKIGLLFSLTVSASAISDDAASGAFTFYFVRSTRPVDYVLGKVAGLCLLALPIMLGGPLLLAGVQLALTPESRHVVDELGVLPRTVVVGLLGTAIYAILPLGFSALAKTRALALGGWAIYYFVLGQVGPVFPMIGLAALGAVDVAGNLSQISWHLAGLDIKMISVPTWAAVLGILVPVIAALAIAVRAVRNAVDTGVGGAS